jgi:hypothetical protein
LGAKLGRHNNVPPNYKIEKYHQLLDTWFFNGGAKHEAKGFIKPKD